MERRAAPGRLFARNKKLLLSSRNWIGPDKGPPRAIARVFEQQIPPLRVRIS